MPVISLATPKGGAGKTTAAILLSTEIARVIKGSGNVVMLDCDPNGSASIWASRGSLPANLKVISDITEKTVMAEIDNHNVDGTVVVIDLEGNPSRLVSRAVGNSDLVIIPMRATSLDMTIGAQAVELIREEEVAFRRPIPFCVLFSATKYVKSREHKQIRKALTGAGIDVLATELAERGAYSQIFNTGGDLYTMPPQGNMEKAQENARSFAAEVIERVS